MRPLKYSINVTLDGCCHHESGLPPDEESMRYWTAEMAQTDALLLGRVTYEMMESAWRKPANGKWPDWNAELMQDSLEQTIQKLKQESGKGLWVGGVMLSLALADLGLIDEYEFLVQPIIAGHGPTLLAGLRERIQLELVERQEFRSGAILLRYRPV